MSDPAATLAFDPSDGTVIRPPPRVGYGHSAGRHKVGNPGAGRRVAALDDAGPGFPAAYAGFGGT